MKGQKNSSRWLATIMDSVHRKPRVIQAAQGIRHGGAMHSSDSDGYELPTRGCHALASAASR